ncbi:MAG TPA: hypothetical protein VNZ54_01815 [bacterium]|jgi:hypothetical protein|nr:hypothetical protein [bacterium]
MPGSERPALIRLGLKLGLAALLLAALCGWLEWEARRAPTSFRQKRLGLDAAAATVQVLVLGPSVGLNAVDPSLWARPGFNLANNGQSLYYDRALLERWAPRLPQLRQVLFAVGRPSLSVTVTSMNESARGFAFCREFGIPHEDPGLRSDPRNFSAALALDPFKVLCWAVNGAGLVLSDLSPDGWESLPPLDEDQQELQLSGLVAQMHALRQRSMMVEPASYGLGHLGAMLALCRARGLRAGVFVPPVTPEFAADCEDGRPADLAALRALCRSQGAAFHDYFHDPRFRDADFADVDHLAAPGAARFTKILEKDFLSNGPPAGAAAH